MARLTPLAVAVLILSASALVVLAQNEMPEPAIPEQGEREILIDDREAKRAAKAGAAEDRVLECPMDRTLPEVTFDAVGLSDVIDFLRDVTNADISVNWRALAAAGIDRNAPVTLGVRNAKLTKAIQCVLDDAGGEKVRLGYEVRDGVIHISAAADLETPLVRTRVYDVRDLVRPKPETGDAEGAARSAILAKLVTGSVAPTSWQANGGASGAIHVVDGKLMVTQTPENHDAIANLLKQTRALLGLPPVEEAAPAAPGATQE